MHRQEGCSAPWEDGIAAEVPGQSRHVPPKGAVGIPWFGSYSGACADESHVQLGNTRGFKGEHIWIRTEHIWSVRVAACLQHPCIVCAMNHFLPFLYSQGEPLSSLHKTTFGKHLPFASMVRLHTSISVSSWVVALKGELGQDSVRVL